MLLYDICLTGKREVEFYGLCMLYPGTVYQVIVTH